MAKLTDLFYDVDFGCQVAAWCKELGWPWSVEQVTECLWELPREVKRGRRFYVDVSWSAGAAGKRWLVLSVPMLRYGDERAVPPFLLILLMRRNRTISIGRWCMGPGAGTVGLLSAMTMEEVTAESFRRSVDALCVEADELAELLGGNAQPWALWRESLPLVPATPTTRQGEGSTDREHEAT